MEDKELEEILEKLYRKYVEGNQASESEGEAIIESQGWDKFLKLVREKKLVVAVVSSPTCSACTFYIPIFTEYASRNRARGVAYVMVDVYRDPETAYALGVMATPTTLIFHKGELVDGFVGAVSYEDLEARIGRWLRKIVGEEEA